MNQKQSSKSYGVAVGLCGIFGMLGVHHFYIGNILHGVFDMTLFIIGMTLIYTPGLELVGLILLLIDLIHTVIIFYRLLVEQQKDGNGNIIYLKIHNNE